MTIDHEQPQPSSRPAPQPGAADEVRLVQWAANVGGAMLLADGLARAVVQTILRDALHDYANWRGAVGNPCLFVAKRILRKAELYRRLRGIEPSAGSEGRALRLLGLAHTAAAVETLPPTARRALEMLLDGDGTFEEIGEALDLSVAGVRGLISRALEKLEQWRPEVRK
ncbi:MAG TPA: sigma factor-like helix-turn-helix DNA-binding protein [Thermoanaerobaculia bacterium]